VILEVVPPKPGRGFFFGGGQESPVRHTHEKCSRTIFFSKMILMKNRNLIAILLPTNILMTMVVILENLREKKHRKKWAL
jgi:hypothetical protein